MPHADSRLQFSLKTILWLMAVVAAFFAGIEFHKAQLRWEAAHPFWQGGVEYWPMTPEYDRERGAAERRAFAESGHKNSPLNN